MTCPRCGSTGIHACPGHPIPAWTPEKVRELHQVLRRYESPASRNQREGRYAGTWQGKHVRRRALVPALMVGGEELFPPFLPFPDNGIAWMTMNARSPVPPILPLRIRYRSKGMTAEVVIDRADADD